MTPRLRTLLPFAALVVLVAGCAVTGPQTRAFVMSDPALVLDWGIERDAELFCGGEEMAGGAISGQATFGALGVLEITNSAAWDVGAANPDPDEAEFEPVGPAGGPFAPVLGPDDYPYDFQVNPFTLACEQVVSATGEFELTTADGDTIVGEVVGGETHRLDFVNEGDGIETFAIIEFTGGTGAFAEASGSFVVHTITRFDYDDLEFVIDLAEVLPGGTIRY
jgi:hypothetical protein